jgi:hypothetical protein
LFYNQCMEIEFSKHASDQLKIRSTITQAMVLDALKSSEEIVKTYRDREIYRKRYGNQLLEVVAVKEDNKIVIITQYFLEQ